MGKRTCPYCAEEIREEALKCKHCGSMMPEFEEQLEEEQRQAEIEEENSIQEMNVQNAKKAIYRGYGVLGIGLILGFLLAYGAKLPWYIIPIIGYIFWSTYWGIRMVHRAVKSFYDSLIVFGRGIVDLIIRQIGMRLSMYLVTIPLVGLLFGMFGGALIKQVQYQKMINSSYEEQNPRQLISFLPPVLLVLILIVAVFQLFTGNVFETRLAEHAKKAAGNVPVINDEAKTRLPEKAPTHKYTGVAAPEVRINAEKVNTLTSFAKSTQSAQPDSMKSFISDYLRANEKKEMDRVMSFYGDTVDYHSRGVVSKSYIMKDKEFFFKSWHMLSHSAASDLRISNSGRPDTIRLTFTCDFNMENNKKIIKGTAKNTWDVENAGSNPKIIAEKQTITYRK